MPLGEMVNPLAPGAVISRIAALKNQHRAMGLRVAIAHMPDLHGHPSRGYLLAISRHRELDAGNLNRSPSFHSSPWDEPDHARGKQLRERRRQ